MFRAVVLIALFAGPAAARETREIKDWWVGCDNLRVCTAFGFPADDGTDMALRLRRDAEADAPPRLDVIVASEPALGVDGPLTLLVDDIVILRTEGPDGSADGFREWPVAPADVGKLLAAVQRGDRLDLKAGDKRVGALSLSGASAALRWIDDRQKRAGTITALVAKGPAPVSSVPSAPALPVIRAARPVGQTGVGSTLPAGVVALLKPFDCAADAIQSDEPESARLEPGVLLWVTPCWVGAYNVSSVLALTNERGGHARLVDLGGEGAADDRAMAVNASFDTDDQTLSSYAKGRGVGDCGLAQTHVWTARGFVLASRTEMSACRGLSGDYWVDTYRSR